MSELTTRKRDKIPAGKFAFPKERKEPLNDASHVRNAIARFNQVEDVTDAERDAAWKRIKSAASSNPLERLNNRRVASNNGISLASR